MHALIQRSARLARQIVFLALLAFAAGPALAQAQPQPYSQTVFFGDSLTDAGFYGPFLIQQVGPQGAFIGRFTTNPGQVWAQFLAQFYGTGGEPAWNLTTTGIVNATGTNYAAGGARVPPSPPTSAAPPSLQCTPGNFVVPGLQYDDRYYTLLFGTRAKVFGLDADAGLNVTLGHDGGRNTSLFLGVGRSF
ncbi:MAG: SGNH/GDSL hydrolase family protein [Luteimonas sp.]